MDEGRRELFDRLLPRAVEEARRRGMSEEESSATSVYCGVGRAAQPFGTGVRGMLLALALGVAASLFAYVSVARKRRGSVR